MAEFIRGGASLPHRDKMNSMNNGCDDGLDSLLPDDFDPFVTEQEDDVTDGSALAAPPDNLWASSGIIGFNDT